MNTNAGLTASFWVTIILQTIGAVDLPGKGVRKMPSPRNYVLTCIIWSILGVVAALGMEKAAAAMAWLTTLAILVLGVPGKAFVHLITQVVTLYGPAQKSGSHNISTTNQTGQ